MRTDRIEKESTLGNISRCRPRVQWNAMHWSGGGGSQEYPFSPVYSHLTPSEPNRVPGGAFALPLNDHLTIVALGATLVDVASDAEKSMRAFKTAWFADRLDGDLQWQPSINSRVTHFRRSIPQPQRCTKWALSTRQRCGVSTHPVSPLRLRSSLNRSRSSASAFV